MKNDQITIIEGYHYLFIELPEVIWQQTVYDSGQDSAMSILSKKALKLNPANGGLHAWLHKSKLLATIFGHTECGDSKRINLKKMPYCVVIKSSSSIENLKQFGEEFKNEYFFHSAIKSVAVLTFPIVYPLSFYVPDHYFNSHLYQLAIEGIEFTSVSPLAGVFTTKFLSNKLWGENTTINNVTDNLAYREFFHEDMAKDPKHQNFIDSFNLWMKI